MQHITAHQAHAALALHANSNSISEHDIKALLGNASITFAQITYVTKVLLAAKFKANTQIHKVTQANVMLCSNIAAHTHVYQRAVRKNAMRFSENNPVSVQGFEAQDNYFEHTDCYSIVAHKQHAHKLYLYAIYNRASSIYVHGNTIVDKHYVASYCTKSEADKLLNPAPVRNVTHNIIHNVRVRTIALSNIVSIKARKQLLTV